MIHSRRNRKRLMSEINVVPYIDVMLVLLVIFMVTAPLLTEGVRVELPQSSANPVENPDNKEPFVITIDAEGQYYSNESKQAITAEEVTKKAVTIRRVNAGTPIYLRGDRAVSYDAVIQALALLQQNGVEGVSLVTDPIAQQ